MTIRHAGYLVTLAEDLREDEPAAEAVTNALRLIKGVIAVEPIVHSHEIVIAQQRVDLEWREQLLEFINTRSRLGRRTGRQP